MSEDAEQQSIVEKCNDDVIRNIEDTEELQEGKMKHESAEQENISASGADVENDENGDDKNALTFTKLDVALLPLSAFLVVLDYFTDWSSVKTVLYITQFYIPLIVSLLLPIIIKLP